MQKAWVGWPFAVNSRPALAGVSALAQPLSQRVTPLLALISGAAFLTAVLAGKPGLKALTVTTTG